MFCVPFATKFIEMYKRERRLMILRASHTCTFRALKCTYDKEVTIVSTGKIHNIGANTQSSFDMNN
jgi:galactose-1-phosphate uridylyltransferase